MRNKYTRKINANIANSEMRPNFQENYRDGHSIVEKLIEKIIVKCGAESIVDLDLVEKAAACSKKYHGNQKRQSGEPYYSHPVEVATILVDDFCETDMLVCALLHDTLEDTKLTRNKIKAEFGEIILNCVDLLTNRPGETLADRITHIINNTNKVNPPRTCRTLIIKIADRLHNMRTLHVKSREKQQRIADETMKLLLPLARKYNLQVIGDELKLLCKKYI